MTGNMVSPILFMEIHIIFIVCPQFINILGSFLISLLSCYSPAVNSGFPWHVLKTFKKFGLFNYSLVYSWNFRTSMSVSSSFNLLFIKTCE